MTNEGRNQKDEKRNKDLFEQVQGSDKAQRSFYEQSQTTYIGDGIYARVGPDELELYTDRLDAGRTIRHWMVLDLHVIQNLKEIMNVYKT